MKINYTFIILLAFIHICAFGKSNSKHIIDYGNHLTDNHISELNKQINHLNTQLKSTFKVIFFDPKQVLDHQVDKEISLDEYLSSISYSDKILLIFSNKSASPDNFWTENLHIKTGVKELTEENIESIKKSCIKDLLNVPFDIKNNENQYKTIYFNTIFNLISNINSSIKSDIEILHVDKDFGAGIESYKNAPAEELEIKYTISEKDASFARIQIYSNVNELVFEKDLKIGKEKVYKWNGKMNKGANKDKYITREMCNYLYSSFPSFKIVIQASKNKTFDYYSQKETFSTVHENTKEFLDAGSFAKSWVYHTSSMPEKNKFRRYIYLRTKYTNTFKEAEMLNVIPISYLKENISTYGFKHSGGEKTLNMRLHKEFQLLINDIVFTGDYSEGFGGSFNMRINVNNTKRISPHGWGIAFDLDVPRNQNLNSAKNFHVFNHVITDKYLYSKNVSDILTEVSGEFNTIMTAHFGAGAKNYSESYAEGITAIGNCYKALSSGDTKANTYMTTLMKFLNPEISLEWSKKFVDVKNEVFLALNITNVNLYMSKVWGGDIFFTYNKDAITACDNFLKETEYIYSLVKSTENINTILSNLDKAFLLKERGFKIDDLNTKQELIAQFALLAHYVESTKTFKELVSHQTPQNFPAKPNSDIFKDDLDGGIKIWDQNYLNVHNEISSCHKCINSYLKGGISYKSIGAKMNSYYAKRANWLAAFKNGFSSIELVDTELWINKKYLKWGGEFRNTKDAMHFELDESECLIPFLSFGHKLKDLPQFKTNE